MAMPVSAAITQVSVRPSASAWAMSPSYHLISPLVRAMHCKPFLAFYVPAVFTCSWKYSLRPIRWVEESRPWLLMSCLRSPMARAV